MIMDQKSIPAEQSRMKRICKRLRRGSAVLVLLAISVGVVQAQVDRTRQPAAGPAPTASFPAYDEFTLDNGLRVFMVRDPRPLVTFRMMVAGGKGSDGDSPGVAEAAADLLTKGTVTRDAGAFAEEVDFLGGSIQATATDDAIDIRAAVLKSQAPRVLELFAEAVRSPAYSAEEVRKYKQEQIAGLRGQMAQAEWLADQAINRILYGDTPYGQVRSDKMIAMLTPESIMSYYKTYVVPGNAMLAVIGDYSVDELRTQLNAVFGDWATGSVPTSARPIFPERRGRRIVLIDRPSSVQSSVRIIGDGPVFSDPLRPKTTILNSILGGGSTGRLYMNLRETHGYTYGAYSGFDANRYGGHFVAAADVRSAVTDSAIIQIMNEIALMQTTEVSRREFDRTIQSAEGKFLLSVADPNITAQRILFTRQYEMPKDYYKDLLGVYRSTSPRELSELARRYLRVEDLSIVVVGKASEIKPQLEKFGTVEVWMADQLGG